MNAGSGKEFSVTVDRLDGFDADVQVDITGLPPGFSISTPVVIQSGHLEAKGTIHAALDAPMPADTNAATTNIISRALLSPTVNKGASDSLAITWNHDIGT